MAPDRVLPAPNSPHAQSLPLYHYSIELLEVMVMVVTRSVCVGGGDECVCECAFWWGKGPSGQLILTKNSFFLLSLS